MATFRQRGTSWEVQIRRKGHRPVTKTFPKKFLAEKWARDQEGQIDDGIYLDTSKASKTLLTELFKKYEEQVTPTKEVSSHIPEKARLRTLARYFPQIALNSLSVELVLGYTRDRLSGDEISGSRGVVSDSIRRELQLLSDVIDSAQILWGIHIVSNPVPNARRVMRKLRMLKPGVKRERRLKPGEYEKIRDSKHVRFTVINRLALFDIETGLRRGELAGARREYMDLSRNIMYVPKSKTDWKTGKKGRVVPLSELAVEIYLSLPKQIDGSIFGIKPHSISQAFDRLCEDQGIVDLRFHDLRHEAISRWFDSGRFELHEVASMSGHEDWRSLKRYTHPDPEKLAQKMRV